MITRIVTYILLLILAVYFPIFYFSAFTGIDLHHWLGGQPTSF